MNAELKLTSHELKVVDFLVLRNNGTVYWEELAQFAKDPQSVKLKSTQRTVSEIKRKYTAAGVQPPFEVSFAVMAAPKQEEPTPNPPQTVGELIKEKLAENLGQKLVQVKKTPDGNVMRMDSNTGTAPKLPAQVDYVLDFMTRSVKTKYGSHKLNEREWEVMKFLYQNVGKIVTVTDLKDKVLYQNWGSKTPARWFDHVKSVIGNIRAAVPGLKTRILTVKGVETGYIFQ